MLCFEATVQACVPTRVYTRWLLLITCLSVLALAHARKASYNSCIPHPDPRPNQACLSVRTHIYIYIYMFLFVQVSCPKPRACNTCQNIRTNSSMSVSAHMQTHIHRRGQVVHSAHINEAFHAISQVIIKHANTSAAWARSCLIVKALAICLLIFLNMWVFILAPPSHAVALRKST